MFLVAQAAFYLHAHFLGSEVCELCNLIYDISFRGSSAAADKYR